MARAVEENLGGFCVFRITLMRGFAGSGLLKIKLLHDPTVQLACKSLCAKTWSG
jgi:hypothetical protein